MQVIDPRAARSTNKNTNHCTMPSSTLFLGWVRVGAPGKNLLCGIVPLKTKQNKGKIVFCCTIDLKTSSEHGELKQGGQAA